MLGSKNEVLKAIGRLIDYQMLVRTACCSVVTQRKDGNFSCGPLWKCSCRDLLINRKEKGKRKKAREAEKATEMVNVLFRVLASVLWLWGCYTYSLWKHQPQASKLRCSSELSHSPGVCSSFCCWLLSSSLSPSLPIFFILGSSTSTFFVSFAVCPPSELTQKKNCRLNRTFTEEGYSLHLDKGRTLRQEVALELLLFYGRAFKNLCRLVQLRALSNTSVTQFIVYGTIINNVGKH